ncbi:MAG: FAD/NAD(P)-binding protein [Ferruginibacter sp.]
MMRSNNTMRIGIIGGGPAALFMYKRLVESGGDKLHITIFEKNNRLGPGMPYSTDGACPEHITNVSDNEIPLIKEHIKDWVEKAPKEILSPYQITEDLFNEYKVLPRLLFGEYLAAQFEKIHHAAKEAGIKTSFLFNTIVTDIEDDSEGEKVTVYTGADRSYTFDSVIICTGHTWPKKLEGKVPGWYDSPYPPSKLAKKINYPVAIKGASLTAIDAVRTLAKNNGSFEKKEDSTLMFKLDPESKGFKIRMHSLNGLLPAIRFHLEDSQLSPGSMLSEEEVQQILKDNQGFISLDYIFDRNFKQPLLKEHPEFYNEIKEMQMEEFVAHMMNLREKLDAFILFKAEYAEAEKSIKRKQSVYWKEMLAVLSYAMNYPAKHLSAEDMIRLKKVLMPLISIVIAFVPQSSCRELMALYDAGVLEVVPVDEHSSVMPMEEGALYKYRDGNGKQIEEKYKLFIDAVGQAPVLYKDFPFDTLKKRGTVSESSVRFLSTEEGSKELNNGNELVTSLDNINYYLKVPGISINDHFQAVDEHGVYNRRIYVMAVPLIAGLNPDYSGLDFCEAASKRIVKAMFNE